MPLVGIGLAFIVAYSVLVLNESPARWVLVTVWVVLVTAWVAFFTDYAVRWWLSGRGGRADFMRRNVPDLLSVLVPVFRAMRVVALLRNVPYFQRRTGKAVRAAVITYAAAYSVIFVYFIAIVTLHVERNAPGATITDFGLAIWWACVTLATVGYGDTYPITTPGRIYAVILMFGGVAIVGTASALVISWITERVAQVNRRNGGQ
ncbi:voltage-gated potassium channel [Glaciihabitans tibetensis]|uniref:Voltage-gated potassium channel n=1 Tax=Glaciihabitans tibetensis TaxID=1266600 RepID=A0A2T0VCW7_9MICO|nr:voltage-gated potassium channel [Glaciihabitans tibetensis]